MQANLRATEEMDDEVGQFKGFWLKTATGRTKKDSDLHMAPLPISVMLVQRWW
jgi:3-methyladenine DNA glycosylase Tag